MERFLSLVVTGNITKILRRAQGGGRFVVEEGGHFGNGGDALPEPEGPGGVFGVFELHQQKRAVRRADRFLGKLHPCLVWGTAPFLDVTFAAGADHVFPGTLAPTSAGNDVVEAQFRDGQALAAILTAMGISGKDRLAARMERRTGHPVEGEKSHDSRHLKLEVDRTDPIVQRTLFSYPSLAQKSPRLEIVVGEIIVFVVDHLGQLGKKQSERPPHAHDVDGHIRSVQHKDACVQGCGRGRVRHVSMDRLPPKRPA